MLDGWGKRLVEVFTPIRRRSRLFNPTQGVCVETRPAKCIKEKRGFDRSGKRGWNCGGRSERKVEEEGLLYRRKTTGENATVLGSSVVRQPAVYCGERRTFP